MREEKLPPTPAQLKHRHPKTKQRKNTTNNRKFPLGFESTLPAHKKTRKKEPRNSCYHSYFSSSWVLREMKCHDNDINVLRTYRSIMNLFRQSSFFSLIVVLVLLVPEECHGFSTNHKTRSGVTQGTPLPTPFPTTTSWSSSSVRRSIVSTRLGNHCPTTNVNDYRRRKGFRQSIQKILSVPSVTRFSSSSRVVLSLAKDDNEKDRSESSSPMQHNQDMSKTNNTTTMLSEMGNESTEAPVSTSVSSTDSSSSSFLPSYRQLIVFTATTILIWISEPLLSLIDTTIVSIAAKKATLAATTAVTTAARRSTPVDIVVQIASLGPSTTLYDSAVYLTYFLAIATTNVISPAFAKRQWKALRQSTSHFMGLAMIFGSLVTAFCLTMGKRIITEIVVGPPTTAVGGIMTAAVASPQQLQIIQLATQYAWIRAMVAPFAVVDFCAQSFCLACLDTTTPAIAVGVASIVNIVGDWFLAPHYGIQGAALATALATVSSCLILVRQVRRRTNEWKKLQEKEEESLPTTKVSTTTAAATTGSPPSTPKTRIVNGAIEFTDQYTSAQDQIDSEQQQQSQRRVKKTWFGKKSVSSTDIPFSSLPDRKSFLELVGLAGPIFIIMMLKVACYSIMTVQATRFGITPLAAHNIMMRFFFFFACFGDSISQATQTFFPQTINPLLKTKLFKRLFLLSLSVGAMISHASHFILTNLGKYLIQDDGILKAMATYAPYMAGALFLHPLVMLMEGTVLARRDLMILVGMYIFTMTVHCGWVLNGVLTTNLAGLWRAFLGFQFLRLIQFTSRVVQWWWQTARTTTATTATDTSRA